MQLNNDITDVKDNDMKYSIGTLWSRFMVVMLTLFLNRNGVITILLFLDVSVIIH